jgi:hypothetical protein
VNHYPISRIWEKVKPIISPLFAIIIMILLSRQMTATMRARETLDLILKQGVVQTRPQEIVSEWATLPGIQSAIHTPRNRGESEDALAARHAAAVRALTEAFIPITDQ